MTDDVKEKSTTELIGVLQAVSIVAKNLAKRLLKLEDEVKRREENSLCGQSRQRRPTGKSGKG